MTSGSDRCTSTAGGAARRSSSRPAPAPTARPGARSTTRSPRRRGPAPTTGQGAAGAMIETHTLADAVADLRALLDAAGKPGRSSSQATRSAGRTPGVRRDLPGRRGRGRARRLVRARRRRPRSTRSSASSSPSTRHNSTACERTCQAWTGSTGRRARSSSGRRRSRASARGAGCSALQTAPRRGHERGDRRHMARRDGVAVAGPDDLHDRVRRRAQHPHRTARHGDRCRASPRRRRSRRLTAGLSSIPMDLPRTIIEPFRIHAVEPIRITTRDERAAALEAAGWNLFAIHADDVLIDLLTDSGTGAMSRDSGRRSSTATSRTPGSPSWYVFLEAVQELFPFPTSSRPTRVERPRRSCSASWAGRTWSSPTTRTSTPRAPTSSSRAPRRSTSSSPRRRPTGDPPVQGKHGCRPARNAARSAR